MKPSNALLLPTAALALISATQALEFITPQDVAIGAETVVEWIGEPSLGISEQSVVLFKDSEPLVTLCEGLISGSGKCSFKLNESDVKTLERGNEGYHIGLRGADGLTLDVS
ncbi:MAG: hypothetical protein J3Q66DRAFT_179270 [Benniella sp.]|nr:MAG: hypothetical protein J3Q66DRAFT_179270 [Benniella sp.]